ncbi:MAG: RHS repeat-associated core domain-containing protein [Anaerolineales bacterium]|nr:MAG: RHS repeat-associated core domain-containing protein [Anaerolineales bacterium]
MNGHSHTLIYDAENRLVEVKKNNVTISQFTYDGDGARVKSVIGSETIRFVGGYYERKGSEITKYYMAGAARVAMRKYTIPQSMTVEYMLGDHLGSTSITTDSNGALVSEMRYKPWGELRYTSTNAPANTSPAYELVKYQFTGQYSYDVEFGLKYYGARFYDSAVGRFVSADTVIPQQTQGTQAWDRYAYTNNNPIRYNDPGGHCIFCSTPSFSFSFNLSATVNSVLNSSGISGSSAVSFLDTTSKVLDIANLAIDTVAAVGDVIAAVEGAFGGGMVSIPEAGAPSVVTVPVGAAVGLGLFEANPIVKGAEIFGNALSTLSTGATALSDVISGEMNVAGSLNVNSEGVDLIYTATAGRDTLTSGALTTMGWLSPIGLTSVPPAAAAVLNDFDLLYFGPFSVIPKSIPVIDINIHEEWE